MHSSSAHEIDRDTAPWLGTHTLLKVLPTDVLKRLVPAMVQVHCAKGGSIYNELASPQQLWILKEGRVRLVRHASSGRTFALSILRSGDVFCIPGIMNRCPYPCRAVADTNAVLLKMPAATFHQLLERYPAFGREALKLVAQECCRSHAVCSASQERVEERLVGILNQLQGIFGPTIPLSRQQLAELAGMSRETANRILLKLQEQGAVRLAFQRLTIQDPARLRSRADRAA